MVPSAQQLSLELTDGVTSRQSRHSMKRVCLAFAVGDCGISEKAVAQAIATGIFGASGLVTNYKQMPRSWQQSKQFSPKA
jgi:hypothetical protein